MTDYIKYLKMAKGDAPDPLHEKILDALIADLGKAQAKSGDSGGSGSNEPPPERGG